MTWFLLILGHLLGDYLFQTRWMGMTKTESGLRGFFACAIHCLVYSAVVSVTMYPALKSPTAALVMGCIAFVCHFPIDRTSFAKYWRSLVLNHSKPSMSNVEYVTSRSADNVVVWWFTYIVTDNTMHLALMAAGISLFLPEIM